MSKFLIFSFLVLSVLFSTFTEAAYVSGQGYTSPFASNQGNSNPFSYSSYTPNSLFGARPTRTSVMDDSFSFPYGQGDLSYSNTRNNAVQTFFNTQNVDRSNTFNEHFVDNFFGAQANFNQNLVNNQDQASSNQNGFDNGAARYSVGDCSTPSYQRTLRGDFKGSRNDFTITETICGGQQMNLQKNFGNTYANNLQSNRQTFQNFINADAATRTNNIDRTTASKDNQQFNQKYDLQQSSFGQGYQLVFH